MDDSLFGIAMPLPVKFLLIFGFVLCVLFAFLWALRRFGTGQLGGAGTRGRQHRLSVLEWAKVDNRRFLCLVRRDNVEHLLIIGGPTDVVVEANIVRAVAASRDVALARPAAVEPLPRAIPLPDNGNGSWPLQPEVITPPPPARPAPKIEPATDEAPAWPPLQPQADTPPARPQRDTLAALADELSARPAPPPPPSRVRTQAPARAPLEARAEPRVVEPRPEPRAPAPAVQSAPTPTPADTAAADQSLAEMAHRLEAALRKPNAPAEARAPSPQPRQEPRQTQPAEQTAAPESPPGPPQPRAARPAEPKPARNVAPAKPPQSTTLYDNLEQEMASLLGRPTNKS
jgi:flagellar protein FliO/FliZ